jgi:hypothetical protein
MAFVTDQAHQVTLIRGRSHGRILTSTQETSASDRCNRRPTIWLYCARNASDRKEIYSVVSHFL